MPRWLVPIMLAAVAVCSGPGCASRERITDHYERACVAADHAVASEAGAEILRRGGNAVDAAVATSFALSVVRPYSCGIGGGGFMVIHLPDDPTHGSVQTAINYRETAPAAVGPDYFERLPEGASTRGGTAVGVPGTVAGLLHALERYGTMEREVVLAPAIRAAEEGFKADAHYVESVRPLVAWFVEDPARQERFSFVWERMLNSGRPYKGMRVRLPEQARALRLIAEHGAAAFYDGPIGRAVVGAVRAAGGEMTADDLRAFVVELARPLRFEFAGRTFLTMPPPSSGGVAMAEALGIAERIGIEPGMPDRERPAAHSFEELASHMNAAMVEFTAAHRSAAYVHPLVEGLKHAFADRAEWLGDPAFVDVPVARLLSEEYLDERAATYDPTRTLDPAAYGTRRGGMPMASEDGGTSHFCVVDAHGGAVSCTETINLVFGSLVAVPEYGFILNNEMDDFTTRRGRPNAFGLTQSDANLPAPGKRPLSSMTPTIVLGAGGAVEVVAGASGGPRIITGTMQAILNVLLWDIDAWSAVRLPRFHHQWSPDVLRVERPWYEGLVAPLGVLPYRQPDELAGSQPGEQVDAQLGVDHLLARGHRVEPIDAVGDVQLIRRDPDGKGWQAASDPRKGGRPAGF